VLQKQFRGMRRSINYNGLNTGRTYEELIERGQDELPDSYQWSDPNTQAKLAIDSLRTINDLLENIDNAYEKGFHDDNVPKPEPELQLRPPL
jgi:hypothetical protein